MVGKVGDSLTSYFQDFGHFEGTISDTTTRRSPARTRDDPIDARQARGKARLAGEKDQGSLQHQRSPGKSALRSKSLAVDPDTRRWHRSRVPHHRRLDLRRCGVGRNPAAQVGTPLAIGACIGRVIRHFPNGFAVKFVKEQSRDELNRLVARHGSGVRASKPSLSSLRTQGPIPRDLSRKRGRRRSANYRCILLNRSQLRACPFTPAAAYGPLRSQGRRVDRFSPLPKGRSAFAGTTIDFARPPTPPASSAGSGRRRSRPSPPCLPAVSAG